MDPKLCQTADNQVLLIPTDEKIAKAMDKWLLEQRMKKETTAYVKDLTVVIELDGEEDVSTAGLITALNGICGKINACRLIHKKKYEITVRSQTAKDKLLDGFRIGETRVHGRDIANDELVVSFMGLPAYIKNEDIIEKLESWGVTAVSEIRRRMWPGTDVADGTRFVRVRFTQAVQSLPYSAKFNTAAGPEFFRVIHDRQVKVCRGCLQPNHVLRECPEFFCRKCGRQGHYARECLEQRAPRCRACNNIGPKCVCGNRDNTSGEGGRLQEEMRGTSLDAHGRDLIELEKNVEASVTQESMGTAPAAEGEAIRVVPGPAQARGEGAQHSSTPNAGAGNAEPGVGEGMALEPCPASEQGRPAVTGSRTAKQDVVKKRSGAEERRLRRSSSRGRMECSPDNSSTPSLEGAVSELVTADPGESHLLVGGGALPNKTHTIPAPPISIMDSDIPMDLVDSKKRPNDNAGKKPSKKSK